VDRGDRRTRRRHHVDDAADPPQVLVEDLPGAGEVHVGLLGPADGEHEPALGEAVRGDLGVHAGVLEVSAHEPIVTSRTGMKRGPGRLYR
jgi:hypothetical protein